ncbi:hypothetical protein BST61_g3730 [Cercospora zeina]
MRKLPHQEESNMSLHFRAPAIIVRNLIDSPEVTIEVVDAGEKKAFKTPRALICAKSEYFEAAFMNNKMKESQTRVMELDEEANVTHAMMKVFITWLHTGLVYADKVDDIPAMAVDRGYTAGPGSKRFATEEAEDEPLAKRSRWEVTPDIEEQGHETVCATVHSPADERDLVVQDALNPTTWPYRCLFDIYVFADRYDTSALRNQIMSIIQYKLTELNHIPGRPESIVFATENLSANSPLRKLLRGWSSSCLLPSNFADARPNMAEFLNGCPQEFLADCLSASIAYRDCQTCPDDHDCERQGHGKDDGVMLYEWHPCAFHEHEKDTKEVRWDCSRLWHALKRIAKRRIGDHGEEVVDYH